MFSTLCYVARYNQKKETWVQIRPYDGQRFISEPLSYRDAGYFLARCMESMNEDFCIIPADVLLDGRMSRPRTSWPDGELGA